MESQKETLSKDSCSCVNRPLYSTTKSTICLVNTPHPKWKKKPFEEPCCLTNYQQNDHIVYWTKCTWAVVIGSLFHIDIAHRSPLSCH